MRLFFAGLVCLIIFPAMSRAQMLNLPDLVRICLSSDMEAAVSELKVKGWASMDSSLDQETGMQYDTWSYGTSHTEYIDEYSMASPAYLNIISSDGNITGLYYTVFEFDQYNGIYSSIKSNGFRKVRPKDLNRDDITAWSDGRLLLFFNAEEVGDDEDAEMSYTAYTAYLLRKADKDSPGAEGFRQEFYPGGELGAEYTLRDGKPEGLVKIYDQAGFVVQEANYRKGVLHGTRKFWFPSVDQNTGLPIEESGELYLVSNYSRGLQHGEETWYYHASYVPYPCERPDSAGAMVADTCRMLVIKKELEILNYRNDLLHGEYISYNEEGEVVSKGRYKKGMMTGKWYNKPEEEER
ncbi:MAG: hypothetical protein RBS37_07690 [Bacteroidales bacterium]|nr:hypothetical protein [Bacteroidales bacterium]